MALHLYDVSISSTALKYSFWDDAQNKRIVFQKDSPKEQLSATQGEEIPESQILEAEAAIAALDMPQWLADAGKALREKIQNDDVRAQFKNGLWDIRWGKDESCNRENRDECLREREKEELSYIMAKDGVKGDGMVNEIGFIYKGIEFSVQTFWGGNPANTASWLKELLANVGDVFPVMQLQSEIDLSVQP